jgi:Heavy metal associated domain 2
MEYEMANPEANGQADHETPGAKSAASAADVAASTPAGANENDGDTNDIVTVATTVGAVAVGAALVEVALLPGIALGVAAMVAPKYVPKLGAALTPMLRSSVRGAYKFSQKAREVVAEAKEQVNDGQRSASLRSTNMDSSVDEVQAAKAKARKPKLKIIHQVPGRIRIKVKSAKGKPEQLEDYKRTLSVIPGIRQVDVNPETGSIILIYDPDRQDDFQLGFQKQANQGGARLRPPTNEIDALAVKIEEEMEYLAEHSDAARAILNFCKSADRQIKVATGNMLDFKMLLAIGVVAFTVVEVGATSATPVWVTLALFGLNHYIEMQAAQHETRAAAAPAAA